jgi:hypothetical protein
MQHTPSFYITQLSILNVEYQLSNDSARTAIRVLMLEQPAPMSCDDLDLFQETLGKACIAHHHAECASRNDSVDSLPTWRKRARRGPRKMTARLQDRRRRRQDRSASYDPFSESLMKLPQVTLRLPTLFLLILTPLVANVLWSRHVQQWLVPALRPYFPAQFQDVGLLNSETNNLTDSNGLLSPEQLLKKCDSHRYTTEIISLDPLVIYINNFTSTQEAEDLIELGYGLFLNCFRLYQFTDRQH